jgi:four helix bundle protein
MVPRELKERSLRFAIDIAALCRSAQTNWAARRVADQMFRSSTSVAANYHAACRARSRREFVAKLGLVVEEAEETVFWLDFAVRTGMVEAGRTAALLNEARELLAIFTASAKTASQNEPPRR